MYRSTAIYASGAGLGSSKGREVGKYQDGYSGYVQMGKDLVSKRVLLRDSKLKLILNRPRNGTIAKDGSCFHAFVFKHSII